METMSPNDKAWLRELAKKQMGYAQLPEMEKLRALWTRHNDLKGERPIFSIEMDTFLPDIPQVLKCTSETGRRIEESLHRITDNYELIGDDKVVPNFFPVSRRGGFNPFGFTVERVFAQGSIGHHFTQWISDLHEEVDALKASTFSCASAEETDREISLLQELFGDILPVKLVGNCLYAVPMQDVIHLMGMESAFFAICDAPDAFHKMMDKLTDGYLAFFTWMQDQHLLVSTTSHGGLGQGSLCYNTTLPDDTKPVEQLRIGDVWGFMDSQETVGISLEMFEEFVFPYYRKICDRFGLLSYGCCEPVHPIFDACLSKLPNLRKLSISPWCDQEMMGERLRGSSIIYHRKPSPNFLGLGSELDEDGWRDHILTTLKAAKGCKLEITQRDVYTLGGNLGKLRRATQIVRELIDAHW